MKSEHIRQGYLWDQVLDRTAKDMIRSVLRGLGPAKRSDPLVVNFALDVAQSWGRNDHRLDRPINVAAMIITGIYFLTREIELSGALQHEMTVHDHGNLCTLLLPATKKDSEGRGVVRTVECMCNMGVVCPSHFLQKYLLQLKEFGEKMMLDSDVLPLFPNPNGNALKKAQVVSIIRDLVKEYMPEASEDIIMRHTGHTFRITGARHFSHLGMDPLTIAIHGRWTSSAILTYLADAPLQGMRSRMKPPDGPKEHSALDKAILDRSEDQHLMERIKALEEVIKPKEPAKAIVTVGYVINLFSTIIHLQKRPEEHEQSHEWSTKCGWKWAGKKHVKISQTAPENSEGLKWSNCPKCFPKERSTRSAPPEDGKESSSSTSSSSSSNSDAC